MRQSAFFNNYYQKGVLWEGFVVRAQLNDNEQDFQIEKHAAKVFI
jgi:hypothetical protein